MIGSLQVSRKVPAPPEAVRRALSSGPTEPAGDTDVVRWSDTTEVLGALSLAAQVERSGDGTTLRLSTDHPPRVPYFGWLFAPLLRRETRQHLRHVADRIAAEATGSEPPGPRKPPVWAPPERLTTAQVRIVATLCFVLAVTGYGGSLLTQTVDYVATSYGATDANLGLVTAVTRVGTLFALAGTALADRRGRRLALLWATGAICAASVLTAAAPNLVVFTALQVIVRGGANLASVVAIIAITEEAPERSRAYLLAFAGLAGSAGFAVGAVLLPAADLGSEAWRILFGLAGLVLVFLPGIARRLPETTRYTALVERGAERGRVRELGGRIYGKRFFIVALTGFLLNVFFAPSSQFTNRYLGEVRGFSGFDILLLRGVTQTLPAVAAVWLGGKIAESHGRKPAAQMGVLLVAFTGAGFFTMTGPLLWIMLLVSTAAVGFAGPALSAFNTELFPTEVRGTAGAGLLAASVAGSVVGLLLAGFLSDPLGGIGYATALMGVGPLVVGLLLIRRLPEARGKLLDDVSPPEV